MKTIFEKIKECIDTNDMDSLQDTLDNVNMDASDENIKAIKDALNRDDPETSLALTLCKQTFTCACCAFFSACTNGYSTWLAQEKLDPRDIDTPVYRGGVCA